MQQCNVKVALGGDRNNVLYKKAVTPIEILLLRQLHGNDSVFEIEVVKEVQWDTKQEFERLKDAYPAHNERIVNLWRDHPGDQFPMTVEKLELTPALLKDAPPLEFADAPAASAA